MNNTYGPVNDKNLPRETMGHLNPACLQLLDDIRENGRVRAEDYNIATVRTMLKRGAVVEVNRGWLTKGDLE